MNKKMIAGLVGCVLGVILVIFGLGTTTSDYELPEIPERVLPSFVSRSSTEARSGEGTAEYVGADAYNFLIEASIRGGEIAGATAARTIYTSTATKVRAIYISVGVLSITIGLNAFAGELDKKEKMPVATPTVE